MSMTAAPYSVPTVRDLPSLVDRLSQAGLLVSVEGETHDHVDHLAFDSRGVRPGSLFVAVRGSQVDGHTFLDKAVQNGATALVCEAVPAGPASAGAARIRVSDSRKALSLLAAAFHGDPASRLATIGVTGTNGKTTTAWLAAQALEHAGRMTGFIGTLGWGRPGLALEESHHTTPDAVALQAALARLAEDGCTACAMEVSSHALDQHRVWGIPFSVAVFTNLTRDHLDYHADTEAYAAAKRRLFDGLDRSAFAVINADDPCSADMVARCDAPVVRYGTGRDVDMRYTLCEDGVDGMRLDLDGRTTRFGLSGRFNAANLAAAYASLRCLGLDAAMAAESLAAARPAPGRFEVIRRTSDRAAVIDYAHTPDALRGVLEAARGLVPPFGRLWCVFGCGGDRDRGKRPLMGDVAESLSDRVVVTSDNPRSEDPEAILFDIRSGMRRPDEAWWIVDRREAIRSAVAAAASGDVIVIAGKGHERVQVVGGERRPFDDREETLDAFAAV